MQKTASQIADQVLEKCSATGSRTKDEFKPGNMAGKGYLAGAFGVGVPAALGNTAAGMSMFDQAADEEELSAYLLKKFKKVVPGIDDVPLNVVDNEAFSSYAPEPAKYMKKKYDKAPDWDLGKILAGKRQINLPVTSNPFIAAHEVGHASGGKLRQALIRHEIPITLASGLGGLGLLGHAALTGEEGEGMGATGYAAPVVSSIAPALEMGEETLATLKARKILADSGTKVKGLGKLMTKQQLGYLLGNTAKIAPVAGGAIALHHYLKKRKEGPTS